jgi:hypothetical protein
MSQLCQPQSESKLFCFFAMASAGFQGFCLNLLLLEFGIETSKVKASMGKMLYRFWCLVSIYLVHVAFS